MVSKKHVCSLSNFNSIWTITQISLQKVFGSPKIPLEISVEDLIGNLMRNIVDDVNIHMQLNVRNQKHH